MRKTRRRGGGVGGEEQSVGAHGNVGPARTNRSGDSPLGLDSSLESSTRDLRRAKRSRELCCYAVTTRYRAAPFEASTPSLSFSRSLFLSLFVFTFYFTKLYRPLPRISSSSKAMIISIERRIDHPRGFIFYDEIRFFLKL